MKNKIKRYRYGFTIAELLITMFIAMIVAAAMVPIVGPKKVKFPEFNKVHGIYECYWDESDIIHAYYADTDSVNGDNNKAITNGTYCTFNPPAGADYYEIYAISSGTTGYDPSAGFPSPVTVQNSVNNYINEGDITLEHFVHDLDNIRAKVTDDLYKIPDPEDNTKTLSLSQAVKKVFGDRWAEGNNYDASDKPYAVITKMSSQVGAVGGGLAYYVSVPNCTHNNPLIYKKGSYVKGKILSSEDGKKPGMAISDYKTEMNNNGYCHGYLHVNGSDAIPGIKLADGYKILIPLSDKIGDLSTTINNGQGTETTVTIGTKSSGNSFQVQYTAQVMSGADAYYFGNNEDGFRIALRGARSRRVKVQNNESVGKIKYVDNNGIIKDLEGFFYSTLKLQDFLSGDLPAPFDKITNPGSEHGQEISISNDGDDNYCYQKNGYCVEKAYSRSYTKDKTRIYDEIVYLDKAFKWWQTGIAAKVDYKPAGLSGNMQVYRTNNLGDGPIYLFPDRDNTQRTIVSKNLDTSKTSDYLVSALNVEVPSETSGTEGWYILYKHMLPYPLDSVIGRTVPNNGKFSYLEAIRSTRFRNNAINNICGNAANNGGKLHCPGFGGAGAYPLISAFDTNFSVGLTNNQDFYEGKKFTQPYNVKYNYRAENKDANGVEPENIPCKGDAGNSFKVGNFDVCRGSNHERGKGAVIIIW